jgi:NAD-dependent dihydropyrimidine dehydrogenase PreA subunit
MVEKLWYKAARTIVRAGIMPIQISDTLIELVQTLITADQAKFILIFKKSTLNLDQIKERTDLKDSALEKMLNELMNNGIIIATPSRSTGIIVYRLMPPIPGIFEFSLMKGETGEKEKKLAKLFDKLLNELTQGTQKNYDYILAQLKKFPPLTRVVPVEEEVEVRQEIVLPQEDIFKIVDQNDIIGLTNCYCRHGKDLNEDPCKMNAPKDICLMFGKSAQFAIEHNFAKPISKPNVKKIIKEAEDFGLVHKIFHVHQDPNREIEGICSCCKCCCGIFRMYYSGANALHTLSSYIANLDENLCIGCGTCVEKCPMETIDLIDTIANINTEKCIGCGVCAHLCPEEAIKLKRTGLRDVFVPPLKML